MGYGIEVKRAIGEAERRAGGFQVRFEAAGGVYVLAKGIDEVNSVLG